MSHNHNRWTAEYANGMRIVRDNLILGAISGLSGLITLSWVQDGKEYVVNFVTRRLYVADEIVAELGPQFAKAEPVCFKRMQFDLSDGVRCLFTAIGMDTKDEAVYIEIYKDNSFRVVSGHTLTV